MSLREICPKVVLFSRWIKEDRLVDGFYHALLWNEMALFLPILDIGLYTTSIPLLDPTLKARWRWNQVSHCRVSLRFSAGVMDRKGAIRGKETGVWDYEFIYT